MLLMKKIHIRKIPHAQTPYVGITSMTKASQMNYLLIVDDK